MILMVYINSNPCQTMLLPTDLRTIIPKNHICYLIEEVVSQLDYAEFDKKVEGAGNPSYHPRICLKIILNGICDRITSSRKLEKLTYENIVFKYLAENLTPDFHTIAMFRKNNRQLIKQCFLQTIEIGKGLDMINFNKLYLDGTKIKANASKEKTFNKDEIDFLSDYVDEHLHNMDKVDEEEEEKFGNTNGEPKIPDHLTKRSKLKEKIKKIMKDIEKGKRDIRKAKSKVEEEKTDKVNFTDMDSKLMKMKNGAGYKQGYNCQLLIEDKSEMIVGNYLSNSTNDIQETIPSMEKFKTEQNISLKDIEMIQDNGYSSSATAEYYEKNEVTAYIPDAATIKELRGKSNKISRFDIDNFELDFDKNQVICPEGHILRFIRKKIRHKDSANWTNVYRADNCEKCQCRKECIRPKCKKKYRQVEINPMMRKIRLRFKKDEGVKKYNKRFHKGEAAFGDILFNMAYREFRMRTKESCENEVNLFSAVFNLKKIKKKLKQLGGSIKDSIPRISLNYYAYNLNI